MAAPPRSSDGPLEVDDEQTPYDVPYGSTYAQGTVYGRSATVYGGTVTDEEDGGLFGFEPEPVPGRHSAPRETALSDRLSAAGLPVVALGLAVLAILIGGIATITGIIAVGRAATAESAAKRAAGAASSAAAAVAPAAASQAAEPSPTPPPPSPSASPSASASPTMDPDHLDPRANYELAYSGQLVRVQPSTCEGTDVDLDEPRVLPPAGADAAYRSCADGFHLDFDDASRFAVVTDPAATAGGCVDAIRANPGVGWVSPNPGTTVCVLTSRLAAEPQQISTKLVRLNIESVEADGTLVAGITAWVVP